MAGRIYWLRLDFLCVSFDTTPPLLKNVGIQSALVKRVQWRIFEISIEIRLGVRILRHCGVCQRALLVIVSVVVPVVD